MLSARSRRVLLSHLAERWVILQKTDCLCRFFLNANNAVDGIVQQVAVFAHVATVLRLLVEGSAEGTVVFLLVFAHMAHHIKQLLGVKMVAHHFAIIAYIYHVERMEQVFLVDVYRILKRF